MKQCPRCHQTYTDADLNFCLNDGELLASMDSGMPHFDDSPPTLAIDPTRVTNPTNWQNMPPPASWQSQPIAVPQQQGFAPYGIPVSPDLTLGIVSMCLGIGSLTVGWCCSLGLLLSPAALITGFIALAQNKKDPQKYGGRGFALAGTITGGVFLVLYLIFILLYGVAILFGNLPH